MQKYHIIYGWILEIFYDKKIVKIIENKSDKHE